MLRKLSIYVPLAIFAVITIVPFFYMFASAVKPKSVLFNAPFWPTDGLFAIDAATGDLTVVDVTHLPPWEQVEQQGQTYELVAARYVGKEEVATRTITVAYGPTPGAEPLFVIPRDPPINTRLGRIEVASPASSDIAADASGSFTLVSYRLIEGNPQGALGVAWGLLTLDNFRSLFLGVPRVEASGEIIRQPTGVGRAILNSFFFASVSSVLATLGAAMGGYALAKFRFKGRDAIDTLVLAALVIPGALLIAPGFQLLYWFGLLDTYTGLILPGIAPAFGVFLFRQAMITSLPDEMIEAARIDGCGEIRLFFVMALPMVRPMAGAFLLITYLGAWNNFIGPQIILQSPEKFPLAVWISQLRGVYGVDYGLIMAGTLVAIAPVLVLFLLLQKEFIAGLTAGAVKG